MTLREEQKVAGGLFDIHTYFYEKDNQSLTIIEASGSKVITNITGEYVQLFSDTDIAQLLDLDGGNFNDWTNLGISTFNGDAQANSRRLYNCEYWGTGYNALYQYFYPAFTQPGSLRIDVTVRYHINNINI